ncbi:hypothetical protein [Amniculibacterium sp. G2-70]|uniref:hypothetical protein n=1 Tax=Amniculibacterium sp. G2-70 TaxID=2767188 RepID=UPI00165437E4|nr:hypothetical protein [Amniculibacterium sp. G2-70]
MVNEPLLEIKKVVEKTSQPISSSLGNSKFSIQGFLTKKEEKEENKSADANTEKLPRNHFTETDLQNEWNYFLKTLQKNDAVAYNAINGFSVVKIGEDDIEITYSSESAKEEFDKCRDQFVNHFKQKVHHYTLNLNYKKVEGAVKVEIITKRKKFEKLVEINPLLKDLNDLLNFDLS